MKVPKRLAACLDGGPAWHAPIRSDKQYVAEPALNVVRALSRWVRTKLCRSMPKLRCSESSGALAFPDEILAEKT